MRGPGVRETRELEVFIVILGQCYVRAHAEIV